jgi:hypothetical protein
MTQPSRQTLTGIAILAAGVLLGAFLYALIGPNWVAIDPAVQNGLVLGLAGFIGGLLALLGAYWAAVIAGRAVAREAEAARIESRHQARIQTRTDLVRRIGTLADRHSQEVAAQVARRAELAGRPFEPPPPISSLAPIEDASNELYALGFLSTADAAQLLLFSLMELDRFRYPPRRDGAVKVIEDLTDDEHVAHEAWQTVQGRMKMHMIDSSLRDGGQDRVLPGGAAPDALWREYQTARHEVEATQQAERRRQPKPAPAPGPAPATRAGRS